MQQKPIGIYDWDWRYRVGFDAGLRDAVQDRLRFLPVGGSECIMLRNQLGWADSFISICELIKYSSLLGQSKVESLIAESRHKFLHVPAEMFDFYLEKIRKQNCLDRKLSRSMTTALEFAVSNEYKPLHNQLFEIVFGKDLPWMLRKARAQEFVAKPQEIMLSRAELPRLIDLFINKIENDPDIKGVIDKFPIQGFKTNILQSEGYAEYWPKELTGDDLDRLILYDNDLSMNFDAMIATLVHEVYPGHGLFYDLARKLNPSFIDHGALCLIEGWATWCEWNFLQNDYSAFARASRLRSLKAFDAKTSKELIDTIDALRGERGEYDDESRTAQLEIAFQYPGFSFSYGLGALWFEQRLTPSNLDAFLPVLMGRPWGDFFDSWSRLDTISSTERHSPSLA